MNIREMVCQPDQLAITWADGYRSEYHSEWLRDNDPANRDARTGQRLIDVADLPENAVIEGGCVTQEGLVQLSWSDSHTAEFSPDWLHDHRSYRSYSETTVVRLWDAANPQVLERFPFASIFNGIADRLAWLETLLRFGIAFLSDVPAEPGKVLDVAALIGWVRETNYGRIFDVRAIPDPNNLAYTSQELGLHTDNPYRQPMPELQILHCLRAGAGGGASLFADGFAVAEHLRTDNWRLFEILATTPVPFEFADATTHLRAVRPIIQRGDSGRLEAIAYNSRSIAPLRLLFGEIPEFYRAYRAFALLLRDERFLLRTELQQGELVIFRNRRVLHGRTAFSTAEPRWLQGCYLDEDGLRSQISVLKRHGYD